MSALAGSTLPSSALRAALPAKQCMQVSGAAASTRPVFTVVCQVRPGLRAALPRISRLSGLTQKASWPRMQQTIPSRHLTERATGVCLATGGGDKPPSGGGPGGRTGGNDNDEGDDEELLNTHEAEAIAANERITLPDDFLEAAAGEGLRKSILEAYIKLQKGFLTRLLSKSQFFRSRLLFDPRFLFIVGAEMVIDTVCATVAEVRKRGENFWSEFEFYFSDLTVGLVLDVLLVGLMATPAVIGKHHAAHGATGLKKWLSRTPKAVFEANTVGEAPYTLVQRGSCLVVKFLEYSLAGIVCGITGQGLANLLMKAKKSILGASPEDLAEPPILLTGLTWGAFMGGSSNLRYQTVFGIERLVDKTIAQRFPAAPYYISFVLRFVNNVVGGENFIDHARWTGVQLSQEERDARDA